ncbi:MAG TPA: hypothetical protein VNQ80_14200 [Parapedobacter sp.]|uniref:hypothetical protein n=1 Tax=Parapedobacter sp. TaxID=1958893 RepID=UPI002CD6497D|nr:hypothetical protein [Parapedobacter sp.]HWK58492.1 hypothetical protein [Parapedobacter sp.]
MVVSNVARKSSRGSAAPQPRIHGIGPNLLGGISEQVFEVSSEDLDFSLLEADPPHFLCKNSNLMVVNTR